MNFFGQYLAFLALLFLNQIFTDFESPLPNSAANISICALLGCELTVSKNASILEIWICKRQVFDDCDLFGSLEWKECGKMVSLKLAMSWSELELELSPETSRSWPENRIPSRRSNWKSNPTEAGRSSWKRTAWWSESPVQIVFFRSF